MVAWTSSGTVAYSQVVMPATLQSALEPISRHQPPECTAPGVGSRGDWEPCGVRLHVVTGKGGTGKTTVAAALALALAAGGNASCSWRSRAGRASRSCSTSHRLPYEERRVAVAPTAARCSRSRLTRRPRC